MGKKFMLYLAIFLGIISYVSAASNLLECDFKSGVCSGNEVALFYANKNMYDADGKVLNSPISINTDSNYDKSLCCRITNPTLGNLVVATENFDGSEAQMSCSNGGEDLMYYTSDTNSRVGFPTSDVFNKTFFSKKLCVKLPDTLSNLDILVSDDSNYKNIGYSCLYKTKTLESNGVVSDCSATYFGGEQYSYTVWGKLNENIESLKCNADCTSKLDTRVYSSCSQKVSACSGIPEDCDGSLYGGWVNLESDPSKQVQCSSPWNNYRENVFTSIKLEVSSVDEKCSNLIKRKYSVILDNELVTMSVYICGD